jgi:NMD protein affecting ribosome stability and mRNA decay
MARCAHCAAEIPANAESCPLCHEKTGASEEAFELELPAGSGEEIPAEWQGGAVYTLELPARCPHCLVPIRTVRVLKLRRTQVSFTSTVPRGGRVIVCPECNRILSAELAAL